MTIVTLEARRILKRYPCGALARLNMIRVIELVKIRFKQVRITLEVFQGPKIPYLKDKEVQNILHLYCDADRLKSIEWLRCEDEELEEIKKELEND